MNLREVCCSIQRSHVFHHMCQNCIPFYASLGNVNIISSSSLCSSICALVPSSALLFVLPAACLSACLAAMTGQPCNNNNVPLLNMLDQTLFWCTYMGWFPLLNIWAGYPCSMIQFNFWTAWSWLSGHFIVYKRGWLPLFNIWGWIPLPQFCFSF